MVFCFRPRKSCGNTLCTGPARRWIAVTYWSLIGLTAFLAAWSLQHGLPPSVLILSFVLCKVAWAFNLMASCGCFGGKPRRRDEEDTRV